MFNGAHRQRREDQRNADEHVRDGTGCGNRRRHLVFRARAAGASCGGGAPGPRSRGDAHRYGRDVRGGARGRDRRRGACGPARRGLPGVEGVAVECLPQRHDRSLRGKPQAAQDRLPRLLPPALAGLLSARRDGCRVRGLADGRQDQGLGREQFRCRRSRGAARRRGCERHRLQPGALSPQGARHRARGAALVRTARRCRRRLQPVRARRLSGTGIIAGQGSRRDRGRA